MSWKHNDLAHDLADHLRSNTARMVWEDMQLGPSGSPRPDIYTLNKSFTRPRPTAYEVKISMSDFRADVTTGKWQKYLDYACSVTFAVPRGLISKADLPTGCGLMVRGDGGWKTLKAPTLHPVMMPQDALLKLLIDGLPRLAAERGRRWINDQKVRKEVGQRYGEAIADYLRDSEAARVKVQTAAERAEQITEHARQQADKIREEAGSLLPDLAEAVGLERDASLAAVRHHIWAIRNQGRVDADLDSLRQTLNRITADFEKLRAHPLVVNGGAS